MKIIKPIFKILLIFLVMVFSSCKTTKYLPVPVETVKTEYVVLKDSVYIHDSIDVYKEIKGDTLYLFKTKYLVKTVIRTDTIAKTDTILNIVEVPITVEVNKLYAWQKWLIYTGAFGIVLLLGMLLYKFKIWKLLF